MVPKIISNLTVSSWNIQGLGDKCKDDQFLSFLKYDINILLETWKGTEPNFSLQNFNVIQKCRKKKKKDPKDLVEELWFFINPGCMKALLN